MMGLLVEKRMKRESAIAQVARPGCFHIHTSPSAISRQLKPNGYTKIGSSLDRKNIRHFNQSRAYLSRLCRARLVLAIYRSLDLLGLKKGKSHREDDSGTNVSGGSRASIGGRSLASPLGSEGAPPFTCHQAVAIPPESPPIAPNTMLNGTE